MTQPRLVPLTGVRTTPLSVDEALDAVAHPRAGAVAVFIGTVRSHDGGREDVCELEYTAHPSADEQLQAIAEAVAHEPGVYGVVAVHRIGTLAVGDRAVVCAVSAEHRGEAFDGARRLIEECKQVVPIWKRQGYSVGHHTWVGL